MTRLVLFELFVTNLYCPSTNKKLLVSWQFSGPYGVTKYGSGWRKDVVNQCLEFGSNLAPKHLRKHETHAPRVKKKKRGGGGGEEEKFRLDSNDFGFICPGVSNVVSYKRNVWYNWSYLLQTYCRLSIVDWNLFFRTSGIICYGSGLGKGVVKQCLQSGGYCVGLSVLPSVWPANSILLRLLHISSICYVCTMHYKVSCIIRQ